VHVANASQVAALAEYLFGSNRTLRNLAVLRVGQDVGAGLILDGQLFFGDGFGAGEIGHMVVDPQGERCACGNSGCLETQVSSQAMVRKARALAATAPDSQLARSLAAASSPGLEVVVEAFRAGDPLAAQLVQSNARYVSQAVAALVSLLNIQQIRLVGSITQFGTPWLEAVRAALPGTAIPDLVCQTAIEIAEHGSDAVILGAAALLLSRELGLTLSRYQEPRNQPRGGGAV
jgi:predicted NBD/HSP70 family sugar kinase